MRGSIVPEKKGEEEDGHYIYRILVEKKGLKCSVCGKEIKVGEFALVYRDPCMGYDYLCEKCASKKEKEIEDYGE